MPETVPAAALLLLAACAAAPPVPLGAQAVVVADGFAFTEGPAVDARGDLYFTDQPNDRILRRSAKGELTTFLSPAGRANGLCFDREGHLLACADEEGQLWSIDPETREVTVLASEFDGARLDGPNDLWVGPDGGVWFTDPFYRRPWWDHDRPRQADERVYHLAPDGTLTVAAEGFARPNGIVGDAAGRHLYVADIGAGHTWEYPILGPGELGRRRLVIDRGSDGLALDDAGHLYLTGEGVTVVEVATGAVAARVSTGRRRASNATFAGSTLYVTAQDALLGVETRVEDGSRPR